MKFEQPERKPGEMLHDEFMRNLAEGKELIEREKQEKNNVGNYIKEWEFQHMGEETSYEQLPTNTEIGNSSGILMSRDLFIPYIIHQARYRIHEYYKHDAPEYTLLDDLTDVKHVTIRKLSDKKLQFEIHKESSGFFTKTRNTARFLLDQNGDISVE